MQLTSQLRLYGLSSDALCTLDALGDYHGRMLRKLYAWVAKRGGKAKQHKTEFCRTFGVSTRLFNSLRTELDGLIEGTTELLKGRQTDLDKSIRALKTKLRRLEVKFFEQIALNRLSVSKTYFEKKVRERAHARARLVKAQQKREAIGARLAAHVPGIGFGSRKLFSKQYNLSANQYSSHKQWLADWRAARSHQCFFLGSKDEAGGNQQCTLFQDKNGVLSLRIRIPDALLKSGDSKYLILPKIDLPYGGEALRAAFDAGQALSWRLHRDTTGWRLFVAFARPEAKKVTAGVPYGALGVDFNADHLAVAETDPDGNFSRNKTRRYDLAFEGKTSGQRAAILADALEAIVSLALELKKPIVIEDLDFTALKKQMAKRSPARARALSGLAYAQFIKLLESKCYLRGVELVKVNPAYTSVAGRIKYARPKGLSVHHAAAGVIARRAQGCIERLPREGEHCIPAHGTTLSFRTPERKVSESHGVLWRKVGTALTGFLRKSFKPTREASRLRSAQGRIRMQGLRPASPERGRRGPAAKSSQSLHEQICAVCI
jgi:IS605 OrfB family transposase